LYKIISDKNIKATFKMSISPKERDPEKCDGGGKNSENKNRKNLS
jgi:hypothetical protein